ncbi:hypothetical protein [Bacillus atrophaeus]|nr:hypothetical protein [Bacillus atrophaeus]MEC5219893.1 hypothetical protein [Bacillus atrophaeus]
MGWIITVLIIILIGFTGNIVSLLREQNRSSKKIIELLEEKKNQ